jgi:hypothetical protein
MSTIKNGFLVNFTEFRLLVEGFLLKMSEL